MVIFIFIALKKSKIIQLTKFYILHFINQKYRREVKDEKDDSESDEDDYVPYVPVKERRKQQLIKLGRLSQLKEDSLLYGAGKSSSENEKDEGEDEDGQVWGRKSNISLLDQHTELKKLAEGRISNNKFK